MFSPIQRMSEVRICRYLVFWALKKVKEPSSKVNAAWEQREKQRT